MGGRERRRSLETLSTGNVPGGLTKHPDVWNSHKVYVHSLQLYSRRITNPKKGTQEFLQGHTNRLLAVSPSQKMGNTLHRVK